MKVRCSPASAPSHSCDHPRSRRKRIMFNERVSREVSGVRLVVLASLCTATQLHRVSLLSQPCLSHNPITCPEP